MIESNLMHLDKKYSIRIKFIWTEHKIKTTYLWMSWPTNIPVLHEWWCSTISSSISCNGAFLEWRPIDIHLSYHPSQFVLQLKINVPFITAIRARSISKREHTAPITLSNLAGNHVLAVRSPYLVSIPTDKPTAPLPVSAN